MRSEYLSSQIIRKPQCPWGFLFVKYWKLLFRGRQICISDVREVYVMATRWQNKLGSP